MGHFEKGAWVDRIPEKLLGKPAIHVGRVLASWGYDGSCCTVSGNNTPIDPKRNYAIIDHINEDGSLAAYILPAIFGCDELSTLSKEWNDDQWVEVPNVVVPDPWVI